MKKLWLIIAMMLLLCACGMDPGQAGKGAPTGVEAVSAGEQMEQTEWKQIYLDYLQEGFLEKVEAPQDHYYGLVYLNNDTIPEIIMQNDLAGGTSYVALTIIDGKVEPLFLEGDTGEAFLFLEVAPEHNVLIEQNKEFERVCNHFYRIGENGWEEIAEGIVYTQYDGQYQISYSWNGEEEDLYSYEELFEELVPIAEVRRWAEGVKYLRLIDYLNGNTYENAPAAFSDLLWNGYPYGEEGVDYQYAYLEGEKEPITLIRSEDSYAVVSWSGEIGYIDHITYMGVVDYYYHPEDNSIEEWIPMDEDGALITTDRVEYGSLYRTLLSKSIVYGEDGYGMKDENGDTIFAYNLDFHFITEETYEALKDEILKLHETGIKLNDLDSFTYMNLEEFQELMQEKGGFVVDWTGQTAAPADGQTQTTEAEAGAKEDTPGEAVAEIVQETPTPAPEEGAWKIDPDGVYTSKDDVALYIHTYDELPKNFMTKKAAQKLGWTGGSLEKYAPGMCIGGDYFGNYEGLLPEGDYHECDIDTLGSSNRGAKRLIYDTDGDIYYTEDHYESFTQIY